ncbi:MAG: tetratricopeptide repeat protein [Bacteroidota bacterium]
MSAHPLTQIQAIRAQLAKGELSEAIPALLELAPHDFQETAMLLSSRFHRMEEEEMDGVLAKSEYRLESNRLSKAALQLCGKLKTHFTNDKTHKYIQLGENLLKEEKYEFALEYFEKAYELDPYQPDLLINMASAKIMLGAFNEAIVDLNEAFEKGSLNTYAYYLRAMAYEAMGMLDKAAADRARLAADDINFKHLE